jgi:hypothetical protein
VTFKIGRWASGKRVTFTFSGVLTGEELGEVVAIIERERSGWITFDLADLTLVTREGVDYLRHAAADGAELVNCPQYIRRWIEAEERDDPPAKPAP